MYFFYNVLRETVSFETKLAGCRCQMALRKMAKIYKVYIKAADQIVSDTYVDDTMRGGHTIEEVVQISAAMDEIIRIIRKLSQIE